MHINHHFLLLECSPVRKINMFENADLYRTNWRERYLMHFHAIVPDIRSSGEPENIPAQIIDEFPAVWNYGKLSAKFFLSSVKVIDTVVFLSFF